MVEAGRGKGWIFPVELGLPGAVTAPNITPDRETGIGAWTDGEKIRAIREGISRDGRVLFPMMPYPNFRMMSDEDVYAIVAYMNTLPAVRNPLPVTKIDFPVSLMIKSVPQPAGIGPAAQSRRQAEVWRIPGHDGRVRRMSHPDGARPTGRWQTPGGRTRVQDAGRHRGQREHHARRRDRHRQVDRTAVSRQVLSIQRLRAEGLAAGRAGGFHADALAGDVAPHSRRSGRDLRLSEDPARRAQRRRDSSGYSKQN